MEYVDCGLGQLCLSHIAVNPVIKGVWGGGRLRAGNISHFLIWSHLGQAGFATAYSVCSLVVPRLEEAILTPVLRKRFKRPSIFGQEGHSYPPKHSKVVVCLGDLEIYFFVPVSGH